MKPRTVIVGGGVAGLAAALRLGEGGRYAPLVLEREPEPGGLAKSLQFKGVCTDLGPHRIHTELPEVARLIERIAAPSLITVSRTSHIYLRGKFLKYPPAPLEMAARLGPLKMLRFIAGFGAERLRRAPLEETYESLMRRAFGKPLYDFLLRPYSAKTWKIDPAELHADTARVRVSAGSLAKMVAGLLRRERRGKETSLREFRYVRGGVRTLVAHLLEHARAAGAQLELQCEAQRFQWDAAGRIEQVAVRIEDEKVSKTIPGDAFISTAPLPILLGRLLEGHPALAAAREAALGLQYLDMVFVCLIVRRKKITGDNWLYFPEPHLIFNRGYEAKNFDPGMGPEDKSVLCLEITQRRGDPWLATPDAEIIKTVTGQIASTGLFSANEVEEAFVYRLPYAYPLYTLDYDVRLDRILADLRRVPNLLTIGRQGLFNHNNMDHSIAMGLRAADLMNAEPLENAVNQWYDEAPLYRRMRIVD